MIGCRPYSTEEYDRVINLFLGRYALRNKALFICGSKMGFRISEITSLRVSDVIQDEQVVDYVTVKKSAMKGKKYSRSVLLHPGAKTALLVWIDEMKKRNWYNPNSFLFRSQIAENRPITGSCAASILKSAFKLAGMKGKLSTHSMRKHFALRMYSLLNNDLYRLSKAIGHANICTTAN